MSRSIAFLASALTLLFALTAMAASAAAAEPTTLATKLSGEGKEGLELTVLAGAKVKDKATLTGKNAAKATGNVTYRVYSDKECKTLVTVAGEVVVTGEVVPASNEVELEGGKTYFWQAHYGGDANNLESTSPCNEVLNVKALLCTFALCETTITPGVSVVLGTAGCTAGPILTIGAERFLLTAGHCLQKPGEETQKVKQKVESAYPKEPAAKKNIGENVTFNDGAEFDTAEVKIENAAWLLVGGGAPAFLVEWEAAAKVAGVIGEAANKVGEETCISGATSKLQCGEVLQTGVTANGTKNLIETSIKAAEGDSGAPEFARTKGGVSIQGTIVSGEGAFAFVGEGKLTTGSTEITAFPQGKEACKKIAEMKTKWPTGVPIEGAGVPAKTTVTECKETGATATIKMSAAATETGVKPVTIGRLNLAFYEPLARIKTVFAGQALLVK
jgi:hypothetical protein